jgi:hypothetical protein
MPETSREQFAQKTVDVDGLATVDPRTRSIAEKRAIGLTYEQIATVHGVSEKTVQRTLAKPDVQDLVSTLQSEMYSESTAQLLNLTSQAVKTLERLMTSESDSVAARAASKVIDMAGPLVAYRNIEQQIAKAVESIEQRLEEL